jgi:hypothetical protein
MEDAQAISGRAVARAAYPSARFIPLPGADLRQHFIRREPGALSARRLASYHKRTEEKEEKKGHNHPYKEKCGQHCPRNENYKGPVKKFDFFHKKKY